jgi:Ca2+-binding RTX toxin-like protein
MSERQIRRRRERVRKVGLGAGAAAGAAVVFAPAAQAGTFTVTSTADDGTEGTLREEIEDANANIGDDTIVFASNVTGTITLDAGPGMGAIEVYEDSLDIQGPGADVLTVSGGDDTRIFLLYGMNNEDDDVRFSGLTLTEASNSAVHSSLGLDEAPDVTIADSIVTDNSTGAFGGGVYAFYSALTITNSQITNNDAYSDITDVDGGGVFSYYANFDGSEPTGVVIQNSIIAGNEADGDGGGALLYGSFGDVIVENSTISGNSAGSDGGGLALYGNEDGAATTIRNSTISGNNAEDNGGGIAWWNTYTPNFGDPGPGLIENTTISGNEASSGGGVYSYNSNDTERTIRNSTIVDNMATGQVRGATNSPGGGIGTYLRDNPGDGAGTAAGEDELRVPSTIVANNSPEDLSDNEGEADFDGTIFVGFSLIEAVGQVDVAESPAGSNLLGVDPQLGALASNGGPTQTHLQALTSPVVDKGIANGLATDQRGLARTGDLALFANAVGGDGTDIGAVEIQAADCQGQGALKLDGSDGNDTLTGTDGPDSISALGGADTADGAGGNDCVNGDAGKDKLKGGGGKDVVKGGAGKDNLKGQGGKDKLKGQGGKDKLNGGGGKDKLSGGAGKDKLRGGPGKDKLKGQGGKDKINAVDGKKDKVNCGGGKDKATVDPEDKVSQNCEKVIVKG